MPVEERASGIAGVNGGIGLDGFVDDQAVGFLHLADGTDDAAGQGSGEAEGIAYGVDFLAHLQIGGVAEDHGLKIGSFDLHDSEIVRLVGADDGGLVLLAIVESDFDLPSVGDDVVVGEDVSFFIDNKARALAFLRH